MRPVTVTTPAATGPSAPVVLDQYLTPTNVSLNVKFGTAAATCSVQYSFDDPWAVYATDYNTNATWYFHPDMNNMLVDRQSTLDGLTPRAVRLNNILWTSGQPTLTVIQAGIK